MSVIEVPGVMTSSPANGDSHDEPFHDEDNLTEEEIHSDDDLSVDSPDRPTDRHGKRSGRGIDMTPPDVHLTKAHRLVAKFSQNGKTDEAMVQLIRCTALCALVYGPDHWQYAQSYANLAQGYIDLKGSGYAAQGEHHAEKARSIFLSAQPQSSSETDKADFLKAKLTTYFVLGRSQALLKKFAEAESSVQKCLTLLSELSRLSCVEQDFLNVTAIKLHTCLARISARLSKWALATSHYENAVDTARRQYGDKHMELISLYQGLGQVEQSQGQHSNHERAIEMYLQAHSIAMANAPDGKSTDVAETAWALATAYSKTGDAIAETSAESYLNESHSVFIQLHGPEHPKVCQVQTDLARLLIRTGQQENGVKLLRSNLKPQTAVFGDFSEEVLETHKMIASLKLADGDLDQALTSFNKCLRVEEMLYGTNSRKSRETKRAIDTILAHPQMANKQAGADLKSRPRFNNLTKPTTRTGVFN